MGRKESLPYEAAALLKLEDSTRDGKPDILARGLSVGVPSESFHVHDDESDRFLDAEPLENDGEVTKVDRNASRWNTAIQTT